MVLPAATAPARSRYRRGWIMLTLALGAAAVALMVMERATTPPVAVVAPAELDGDPDVYMEGAEISQFTPAGTLQYRLSADAIRYFEGAARTELVAPGVTLIDDEGPPWRVSARYGELYRPPEGAEGEEIVDLREDVVLEQNPGAGDRIELVTAALRLYPQRQYAETDEDVMIRGKVGQTTATGLEGDLQQGTLRLFSAGDQPVHTVLQPAQFK